MPLPRQTPVASRSAGEVGFQPASRRAISAAATAYWANVDMRRWSAGVSSQSAAFQTSCEAVAVEAVGTRPAMGLPSSRHLAWGSRWETLTMPESPATRRRHVGRTPTPSGVMAPRPVATTRRIMVRPYSAAGRVQDAVGDGRLRKLGFWRRTGENPGEAEMEAGSMDDGSLQGCHVPF